MNPVKYLWTRCDTCSDVWRNEQCKPNPRDPGKKICEECLAKITNYHKDQGLVIAHYDERPAEKKNYLPMITDSYLWSHIQETYVQVLVEFLGEYLWINVDKSDLLGMQK